MRFIATVVIVVICTIGATAPAAAWWEYAKWGMTEKQLVAASKNAAQVCQGNDGICRSPFRDFKPKLYVPDLMVAGLPAHAQFDFDSQGKLKWTLIWFRKDPVNFGKLRAALIGVYGPSSDHYRQWPENVTWRDEKKGTIIRLWNFDGGDVRLEYVPIAKGL